jgi:hypothetical protein
MKKLILIFILLSFIKLTFTQENNKYIFSSSSDIKSTLFLGPELKISKLIDNYQLYTGLKVAILFNDKIAFGLAGGGFVTEEVFNGLNDLGEEAALNTISGYGGFYIDYIIPTESPVMISFPMLIGVAGIALFTPQEVNNLITDDRLIEGGVFFIYEPAVNAEVNITGFLRMGMGIGYRFAVRGDMDRVSARDFSAFTFNWNFKFGSF